MGDLSPELLAGIIGLFMPAVISLFKNPGWPVWARTAVAAFVSFLVGTVTVVVDGTLTLDGLDEPGGLFTAAAVAFTSSTIVYKAWFERTTANARLEAVGTGNKLE